MAYDLKLLGVLAYTGGFTLWHYRTDDSVEALMTDGYWSAASDMLRSGDAIVVNKTQSDGAVTTHLLCVGRVVDGRVHMSRPC